MTTLEKYREEVKAFREYIEYSLVNAWKEEEKGNSKPIEDVYNSGFQITFRGATLNLDFAPCEFDAITHCLEIIEEGY